MVEFINKYIFGVAVPTLLIAAGIFYAVRLRAFHILHPIRIIKALTKRNTASGISPFKAVTLALAGTLGVGNIVGVAAAIGLGGFGAVFWMWISAVCAMLLKYAEIVLAVRHRRYGESGAPHGSAMYYIRDFFSSHSLPMLGKLLALIFSFLYILNALSMGSMIQANAISESMEGVFGVSPLILGGAVAIICAFLISRGTDFVAKFTEILVPLMTLGYIVISVAVLFIKRGELPQALASILSDALTPDSAFGGILGFALSRSVRFGTMRGLVSNEAGCGTAPTAHAASNTSSAVEQGFWGIFEVFVDTIILCTMTALVIIVSSDELRYRGSWIMLTIDAYSAVLGRLAAVFLSLAVLSFGFATIVCWAHYGIESVHYLNKKEIWRRIFIAVYCVSIFAGFIAAPDGIWTAADFAIGGMTLINLLAICLMNREVKQETLEYFQSKPRKKPKNTKKKGI